MAERLSVFVRPRIADCSAVLADAGKRLKKWNKSADFYGYTGTDKNTVRQIAAAIYASVKAMGIEKDQESDFSAPLRAARPGSVLKDRAASPAELAVFLAACFEAARLNPVIAVGKNDVAVGVWLYESCFLDTVTDDAEIVGNMSPRASTTSDFSTWRTSIPPPMRRSRPRRGISARS